MRRISFRGEKDNPFKVKRVKRIIKRLTPFVLIIGLLTALAIFLTSLSGSESVTLNIPFFRNPLKSYEARVNVLFLGIAGGTHQGASLTDTIMVASYNLKNNQVYLISIPRDLWLPEFRTKSNAVYQMGLTKGNGLNFSRTVMGNILGIPIHYALRIDFRGFIEAVDTLEGIEVVVDQSFDDYNYPVTGKENDLCGYEEKEMDFSEEEAKKLNITSGKQKVLVSPEGNIATDSAKEDQGAKYFTCRYEHISFKKGITHMDGETALKFVRSRHGTNGQGSDFARSSRQEKVLQAIRNKVLSLETLFNPARITELIGAFDKSIDTNISVKEVLEFYKLSKLLDKTHSFVLDDSLLIHPNPADYGGAYVLISQDDDFSIVHGYVKKILEGEVTEYEATSSARPGS